jgi:hypothetical protein
MKAPEKKDHKLNKFKYRVHNPRISTATLPKLDPNIGTLRRVLDQYVRCHAMNFLTNQSIYYNPFIKTPPLPRRPARKRPPPPVLWIRNDFFGSDPGSDFSESSGSDPGSGSCMNTYTHTQISTHIHTYIHTDTQTYTNTHT